MNIKINRREFIRSAGAVAGAALTPRNGPGAWFTTAEEKPLDDAGESAILFETSHAVHNTRYQSALDLLTSNIRVMPGYAKPLLIEGSSYLGVWLECGPQEGLVYSLVHPDIARNNHTAFFDLQREDGQIPCNVKSTETGHGQIQMVVPIAATAWELAQQTNDEKLIEQAYASCSRWDAWLRRYRDTRRTGLCEGFCTYDTGHDNSPRWAGVPNQCPHADARKCPPIPSLPRLCPDLSATVYGGRVALTEMARALGKNRESDRWKQDAEAIRSLILKRLYSAADASFYDLNAQGQFIRIRGDVISRVLGEHVADQQLFETIYSRQIHNPRSFWAPYLLPSIALDDPKFVRPIPRNSWGGASQALTALRAPRWMEHYGKPADLGHMMEQWTTAILRASDFWQQLDPLTGEFTPDTGGYSPTALVLLDFTWRLAGVRAVNGKLEWNVRPPATDVRSRFRLKAKPTIIAELRYAAGRSELLLNGNSLLKVNGTVRLATTMEGKLENATGIGTERSSITLLATGIRERRFSIEPNQTITLT
jgi:hypothetical protein